MTPLLSCQAISKSFGSKALFNGVSFSIAEGDRIGVVGPNGVGKSTLMQILAGQDSSDQGQVTTRKGLRSSFIAQSPAFPPQQSILACLQAAGQQRGLLPDEAEVQAQRLISQIGFSNGAQMAGELSGGWQKRLAIACGVMGQPDLLFLDEPTNHLDWDGILWLESFLAKASFTWMMISHDRYILNQTATQILEINPQFPAFTLVSHGNYEQHLLKKEAYLQTQAQYEESLANKVRREEEWLRRGPKARGTKAKYRIDQAKDLQDELRQVRQRALSQDTQIEFSSSERKTKNLVTLKKASLHRGDKTILRDFSYSLTSGRFIGLLGGNGVGKSSLLKLLHGDLSATTGSIERANQLQVVYFDQQRQSLDLGLTLHKALAEHGDTVLFQGRALHVVSWAKKFGFRAEQLDTPLGKLSGGEQARVLIARLMLVPADLLLLDEPSNDLDIPTLEVLEESLLEYSGALVLVSHDRYMLARLCDSFLALDGTGRAIEYADLGQWQAHYQAATKEKSQRSKASKATQAVTSPDKSKKKLSYLEQREFEQMEENILLAEEELASLQAASVQPELASNAKKLQEVYQALQAAQERVDALYRRWSELENKAPS